MELNPTRHLSAAFNWLMPRRCFACGVVLRQIDDPCCRKCYAHLPFQHHCCSRCGQAFNANQDYCGGCLVAPPPFDACFCPFRYADPIKQQIQRFKYTDRPDLAVDLARILYKEIDANNLVLPDLLVPVPIHIKRLRARGYNQSLLLARELGKLMQLPHSSGIIEKYKATLPQAGQTLKQRKVNINNSFRMRKPPLAGSVAIVDDVVTSGSTAAEIAKILKRNGVDYVQVWGIAHTI